MRRVLLCQLAGLLCGRFLRIPELILKIILCRIPGKIGGAAQFFILFPLAMLRRICYNLRKYQISGKGSFNI